MSYYTGSSCENIFKKYPEIHRSNPKEKSGYYRLNNNQWTYCDMAEIATSVADFISICSVVEVGESRMKSISYKNYQSFLPSKSCESIYNSSKGSQSAPGYYWITSRVYCGMNYTELSCKNIYTMFPEAQNKSGYYRIKMKNAYKWIYCDMKAIASADANNFISTCAGVGGGWRRIVNIDISAGDNCPGEWRKATQEGVSFCRVASDGNFTCSSANFSTNGISYQRVCGRARGYQKGPTLGFFIFNKPNPTSSDDYYASGLSITYSSNPRQHIWSFVSGHSERSRNHGNCPCASVALNTPPSFIANNYYCESAALYTPYYSTYFLNDTLWDGAGCTGGTCCDDTTQPWFYRQLNQITQDDIEARIYAYGRFIYRSPLIDQLELYIQ